MNIKPNTTTLTTIRETAPRNGLNHLNKSTNTAPNTPVTNGSPPSREVSFSPLAEQIRQAEQALNKNSSKDIDHAKVAQLREALQSGELKMDPTRIANGLLQSVRDLFTS